jgi:CheY-like chemotaxis protein
VPKRQKLPRRIAASGEYRTEHDARVVGEGRAAAKPKASKGQLNLTGLKVVVVDDDEDSVEYFALALRTHGAVVMTAVNAIDALRLVQEQHPDVVLSDIAMVGGDGYWLLREIRRLGDDEVRRVPVVATTAYGREHSRERTLVAGFIDHLAKPVDPDMLCQAMGERHADNRQSHSRDGTRVVTIATI